MELKSWYGVVPKVKFKSNGIMADPTLIFEGMEFNYWDIVEPVYDMYCDHLKDKIEDDYTVEVNTDPGLDDEFFIEWLEFNTEMIYQYLWDCVAGGYFGSEDE